MTRDNDWSHRRDLSRRPLKRWQRRWKDGWTHDLEAPGARRNAHIDMWVFDHGLLRLGWRNLHEVAPGVWRGNQPGPRQIRRMAEHGLRSILNLRGATEFGSYLLERETCTAVGVRLYDLKSSSRHPPSREWIDRLDAIFTEAKRDLLIHCKSGSDRAGFAAALYLLLHADAPVDAALTQLSWRYLHFAGARTGILRHFLESYARDQVSEGVAFRDWLETRYDPEVLAASFQSRATADLVVDRVLRRE